MVWRIFVSWVNETARDWRKICDEVLNDLQTPTQIFFNKIKKNKMGGHVVCVSDWKVLYRVCGCLENLIQVCGCLEVLIQRVWVLGETYTACLGA